MFTLKFTTDNAAFEDLDRDEMCAAILRSVATKILSGYESGPVMDTNGNKIGTWKLED